MVRRAATATLAIDVDREGTSPLYVQIYGQLRDLILSGRLTAGARLPSSRALMTELGVSRTAVLQAFEQLGSEGYIEFRAGSGTYVPEVLPDIPVAAVTKRRVGREQRRQAPTLSAFAAGLSPAPGPIDRLPRAFHPGWPDTSQFPFDVWARLMARFWRRPPRNLVAARAAEGYQPLREAIAAHLRSLRGLDCEPSQVIITSSAREAMAMIARTLLDPGDEVWVEDPGYAAIRHALAATGAALQPISVDGDGISVIDGLAKGPRARMAVVTPSRQFPLGVTMALARRLALLEWANDVGAWIVEDDYDSEYRYAGRPLSALQSLDDGGRVIYLGSFSKVLFRTLRIGYIVAPAELVEPLIRIRNELGEEPSIAVQPALAEFIASGHFGQHIRRMRRLYLSRQLALLAALERHAGGLLEAERQEGGMHLVARLTPALARRLDDRSAEARAAAAGLIAPALSQTYLGQARSEGLLLGYAGVPADEMAPATERLARALKA